MMILITFINILAIALLAYWVWEKTGRQDLRIFLSGLAFKLACGIGIGILYTYYYGNAGDTFLFFEDASLLADIARTDPWRYLNTMFGDGTVADLHYDVPRALFFVKLLSVINVLTADTYWLSSIWLSIVSFLACWRVSRMLIEVYPERWAAAYASFLFVPSFVFWSSGIVKESLAGAAMAIIIIYYVQAMKRLPIRWFALLEIPVALLVLLSLKYYWAAVLVITMTTSLIFQWTLSKRIQLGMTSVLSWLAIFSALALVGSFLHPNFYLSRFLDVIVDNNNQYMMISRPDNVIRYYALSSNWFSILVNSPLALLAGLFRPTVLEINSLTSALAAIENGAVLVLVLYWIRQWRLPNVTSEDRILLLSAVVYVIVLCVFLALSTPNLGTLSRYRSGFLPILIFVLMAGNPVITKWQRAWEKVRS